MKTKNISHTLFGGAGAALLLMIPVFVAGAEIQHHSISNVYDGQAVVKNHTPSGDDFYTCSLATGECSEQADDAGPLYPSINGREPSVVSRLGNYGATQMTLSLGSSLYSLYDLSGDTEKLVTVLLISGTIEKTLFSPDESTFVVLTSDGRATFYDLPDRQQWNVTLDQTELPYFSVSPEAEYVSAYNWNREAHQIWNTRTGVKLEVPGDVSFIEYSEDSSHAAFLRANDGFRNLYEVALPTGEVTPVATGDFIVEDYTYLDDTVYYLANEESPLSWNLHSGTSSAVVAENVSYNTYLTRYDDAIIYGKIDDKNIDLYAFDGTTHTRLAATDVHERREGLTREEITIADRTAAHVRPSDIESGDLYIWLHGGPRRQTSVGYHPYLSYAVYDELMEDIAAAGNHVVKLDYAGSWGYGSDFIELLQNQVGKVEIDDVENVIEEFTAEHDVENVYLIGNSYGGYMALRGVNALNDELDGVISINGVSNWYTLISEIPSSPFNTLFNGTPNTDNLPLYLNASAFTEVEDIDEDTPILVIYGTEDKTVPPRQSTEYVTFMEQAGKNVIDVPLLGAEHTITKRENLNELCSAVKDTFNIDALTCQ